MHFSASEILPKDATVRVLLEPLAPFLVDGVTEICVNRPGEVFVETDAAGWQRYDAPLLTATHCDSLAQAIATFSEQGLDQEKPILSAMLPTGERVQILKPPAVDASAAIFSIRRPSATIKPLQDYAYEGAFNRFAWADTVPELRSRLPELTEIDRLLLEHLQQRQLASFLSAAVKERKNLAVVGATGSGKTTLMKSVCQEIPKDERLISIEDVRELLLPKHPNSLHLLYSKGQQGVADITPTELIAASMRLYPTRILLAELRGAEAFDFLKLLTTGHAGSITSFHAESCALAAERYVFMAKEHPDAGLLDSSTLKRLFTLTIDIVIHVVSRNLYDQDGEVIGKDRYVSEVLFDPLAKLRTQFGDGRVLRG